MTIPVSIVRLNKDLPLPRYAEHGDAGFDLLSAEDVVIAPGQRTLVATGVQLALPDGFVGLIHPRSGLAAKHGITVLNAPGTIDSGYRGEIKVILLNTSDAPFTIEVGHRIAQMIVQKFATVSFVEVETLDVTSRGDAGFGSTGLSAHR